MFGDALQEMHNLKRKMDKVFGQEERPKKRAKKSAEGKPIESTWEPLCDLYETDDSFNIVCELPSLKKEDVCLEFLGGTLRLSGCKQNSLPNGVRILSRERSVGKFSRTFHMPDNLDAKKIAASFENGQLHIVIPKPEAPKEHKIQIQ